MKTSISLHSSNCNSQLADVFKRQADKIGLSIYQISKNANFGNGTANAAFRGKISRLKTIAKIAQVLKMSVRLTFIEEEEE